MSTHPLSPYERKIITLAALGGMLEFYDFIIYGVFTIYFSHQFFPSHNDLLTVTQSYFILFLGYIARPIGGIIFSHIGDEYGRKKVLIITIFLMGAASLGIGFLPTYSQIGIAAPILLLLLRLIQGLALGGELPSTYVYISESITSNKGLAFGITMVGVNSGLLLGMLINQTLNYFLTIEQLTVFGWRLPFIFGGMLCMVSYKIRKTLHETAAFQHIHHKPKFPILYLFQHHFLEFLRAAAIVALMSSLAVVTIVFMPTYLHDILKIDMHTINTSMTILTIFNVATIYFSGKMAQYIKPQVMLKGLVVLCVPLIPLGYFLLHEAHILAGLIIFGFLEGVGALLTPYVITSFFESRIRLTGVALSYNMGFTLFGGVAPLLITNIIKTHGTIYSTPCIYLLVMALICSVGLYRRPRMRSYQK